jgi:MurNAc alpha-1-phosphate uridylyltransferase
VTETIPGLPAIAMVLAAGRGERLRPLTDRLPKPLVEVAGRSLIDRLLDRLAVSGVTTAVVNLHYKARMVRGHLDNRAAHRGPALKFSEEADGLLDTGGGVAKALPLLGDGPFLVANSDFIWRDAVDDSLARMADRWNADRMDALLLLQPTVAAHGYRGTGDFQMAPDGALRRRHNREVTPFLFTGLQILHPRLFVDCPTGPFSLNLLFDKAERAGRLFGLRHDGDWIEVGTPEGLAVAERLLSQS